MKYAVLILVLISSLLGSVIKSPIIMVDEDKKSATIEIDKIDVGMSGFVVHKLDEDHSTIIKNILVTDYNQDSKIATLKISDYELLDNDALPKGKWEVQVGDIAVLAFGYTRALLIAPNENIYHRITKNTQNIQWVHPDIFATILSYNGHPTPLKGDFAEMCNTTAVGILFFYLEQRVFTVDCLSFKVLNISEAPLIQEETILPFYSRVEEIDANWFGEGSDRLEDYEPYYYELLTKFNKNDKKLNDIFQKSEKKSLDSTDKSEIEE